MKSIFEVRETLIICASAKTTNTLYFPW